MKLLSFGIFICTATTYRLREYPVVSSRAKQKPKNPDALADCTTYLFGIISLVVYFFAVRGQSIPRKLVRVGWSTPTLEKGVLKLYIPAQTGTEEASYAHTHWAHHTICPLYKSVSARSLGLEEEFLFFFHFPRNSIIILHL